MAYYLGIDGGGTKTICAVGTDDSLIATAEAGASNVIRVGEAEARQSLHQAIGQACAAAGISPAQVTRACVGAAGAASADVVAIIQRIMAEIVSAEVLVTGDMQIALEAAFPAKAGIILIAGTGSIAYGRDGNGKTARAGGWGFAASDEGSAHWIGRSAIVEIFRAFDLAQATSDMQAHEPGSRGKQPLHVDIPLFDAVRQVWNIAAVDELVRAANSAPPPNFAALFPAIVVCAEAGDAPSQSILTGAGGELAELAGIVITKLFPLAAHDSDTSAGSARQPSSLSGDVPLGMVGGVFRHSRLVREVFYNEARKRDARVKVLEQVVQPVDGALRLARLSH